MPSLPFLYAKAIQNMHIVPFTTDYCLKLSHLHCSDPDVYDDVVDDDYRRIALDAVMSC